MRHTTIGSFVAISSAVALFACKDTTASGPSAVGSESSFIPSGPVFERLPAGCRHVQGDAEMTLVPSPNDPNGRTVGPTKGGLKGAATSVVTGVLVGIHGVFAVFSLDTWVVGPTDLLLASGEATYVPIDGAPVGEVSVAGTETINGGTGKYAGATGTLDITGVGHNVFSPNGGPGNTWFDLKYDGTVCT